MSIIAAEVVTEDDIPDDGEVVQVRAANRELFRVRRVGARKKRHHYEVWHAFLWEQQPLTLTNWKKCATFTAAIGLIIRHGTD